MATPTQATIRAEIVRLAHLGLELRDFAREVSRVLRRAVPFDGVAIVAFDPATALPVDKWVENSVTGSAGSRLAEIELYEPDVNKFQELVVSGRRAAAMSGATGGRLERSRRYRELLRHQGFGDELRVACVADSGAWGAIVLHRERGARDFAPRDVSLLASLSGELAEALQRVSLDRALAADGDEREPGLLILDDEDGIETCNAAAGAWLDELGADESGLPVVVIEVARRAREIASGRTDVPAKARVPTAAGRWVLVRGSVLGTGADAHAAITLDPARAPELAELVVTAYGLTARERRVTELVAQGLSTAAIADRLHLSTFTIQDHLKAIFEKLGVSSRGELVARLFIDHYYVDGRLHDPWRSLGAQNTS